MTASTVSYVSIEEVALWTVSELVSPRNAKGAEVFQGVKHSGTLHNATPAGRVPFRPPF
jgi:hypothetical protein